MNFPKELLYLTSLVGLVLCKDDFYPQYEQHYGGMNSYQQKSFNKSILEKSTTIKEFLDNSGKRTMIQDVLYDNLKEIYDREKATKKYSHPDDQELYLAVRKYTPTLASSEISKWIHTINSQYQSILGTNETSHVSTKTSRAKLKSTQFSAICESERNNVKEEDNPFESIKDHESFKSFLLSEAEKRNRSLDEFLTLIEKNTPGRESLEMTTEHPAFNSSYYKYIENKFKDFEEDNKMMQNNNLLFPYHVTPFDPKREDFYQDRLFEKEVFQNTAELLGGHYVDRLYPSLEKTQQVQDGTTKMREDLTFGDPRQNIPSIDQSDYYNMGEDILNTEGSTSGKYIHNRDILNTEGSTSRKYIHNRDILNTEGSTSEKYINNHNILNKEGSTSEKYIHSRHILNTEGSTSAKCMHDRNLKEMSTKSIQSTLLNVIEHQESLMESKQCPTCSNKTYHHRFYRRRHRRIHRSHKRRHYKKYRGPGYIPPNPFLFNTYCPPPFPYPPQYYQHPPQYHQHPPPQYYQHPQPPNYYHFTAKNNDDNSLDSRPQSTADDQFALYLKLKNIFQPVDKVLGDMGNSPSFSIRDGTLDPVDIQKYKEKHLDRISTSLADSLKNHGDIEKQHPEDKNEDQRRFYTSCTHSIRDHYPDYPTASVSPWKHRHHHRKHRGRHRSCCHHHHRRRPRHNNYRSRNPERKYQEDGKVRETQQLDKEDVPKENLEN